MNYYELGFNSGNDGQRKNKYVKRRGLFQKNLYSNNKLGEIKSKLDRILQYDWLRGICHLVYTMG